MHHFNYKRNQLYAEGIPVSELAGTYGTPLYVYSHATLTRHIDAYLTAFDGVPNNICFAVKACPNIAVIRTLAARGAGADVVSGGELFRALKAGVPASKIVYAGVGKTEDEIRYAIRSGILMFNIESGDELAEINRVAGTMKATAPISLRVNPDVDPRTHPYISTGLRKHKFGIPMEQALEYYVAASKMKHVRIVGIHKHIGSQITKTTPFADAIKRVLALVDELRTRGIEITHIDIGGGLGIPYHNEKTPMPADLARRVLPLIKGRGLTLVAEPGRSIVGNAGILVTKALYLKEGPKKTFVIVDGGMNDLIRPTLYDAYHEILPVRRRAGRRPELSDIVGPICESGDFLAKDRLIPRTTQGEYLAVMSAGAYGFSMSSNYNSRPRAAEVMVMGDQHFLIRRREKYPDLIRGELIPKELG